MRVNKITAIINAHREGDLAVQSIKAMAKNLQEATSAGYHVETIAVLDNADEQTTSVFESRQLKFDKILKTSFGDLGQARNEAIRHATGDVASFLDADDLWCASWLASAARLIDSKSGVNIIHPRLNVYFGGEHHVMVHPDTTDSNFDYLSLLYNNLWTALVAAPLEVFRNVPYKAANRREGFGYEDWTWNADTVAAGYRHLCEMSSVHFIRVKRATSLSKELKTSGAWRIRSESFRSLIQSRL